MKYIMYSHDRKCIWRGTNGPPWIQFSELTEGKMWNLLIYLNTHTEIYMTVYNNSWHLAPVPEGNCHPKGIRREASAEFLRLSMWTESFLVAFLCLWYDTAGDQTYILQISKKVVLLSHTKNLNLDKIKKKIKQDCI